MNQTNSEARPSPPVFDKEAYTGLIGRYCRYRGDAGNGIEIELSPGDVLAVTATQIQQIFADLSALNLLLEDPSGLHRSPTIVQSIKAAARARRDRRANRANPQSRGDPFSHLVSPRFAAWLNAHDIALWNRHIGNQQAVCMQAAFCGEGLLPLEMDRPGDFPIADLLTSLQALVGRRVIYEESRRFALVELSSSVTYGSEGVNQIFLTLTNLCAPGFSLEFPSHFRVGGSCDATSMSHGAICGYMDTWKLITSPRAVARICEQAPGLNRYDLLKVCRKVEYGDRTLSGY